MLRDWEVERFKLDPLTLKTYTTENDPAGKRVKPL